MAEGRARLDWYRTSTAVARVINAFGAKAADDWLVPADLRRQPPPQPPEEPYEPKADVDLLVQVFCRNQPPNPQSPIPNPSPLCPPPTSEPAAPTSR